MSHDLLPKEPGSVRPLGDRAVLEGDIMVTAIGEHFTIGRLKADRGAQELLGTQRDRTAALRQACALAGPDHRVFLYTSASQRSYLPFDCSEVQE